MEIEWDVPFRGGVLRQDLLAFRVKGTWKRPHVLGRSIATRTTTNLGQFVVLKVLVGPTEH